MLFFKMNLRYPTAFADNDDNNHANRYERAEWVQTRLENCNKLCEGLYVTTAHVNADSATLGICAKKIRVWEKYSPQIAAAFQPEAETESCEEITCEQFLSILRRADRMCYVDDDGDVLEKLGIRSQLGLEYEERILREGKERSDYEADAACCAMTDAVLQELERIYTPSTQPYVGHPVHYMVCCDSRWMQSDTCELLLGALRQNGRVKSSRYIGFDVALDDEISLHDLRYIYENAVDGAVVIRVVGEGSADGGDTVTADRLNVSRIAEMAARYRNHVLTILCLPRAATQLKKVFYEELLGVKILEIAEEDLDRAGAVAYLTALYKDDDVHPDEAFFATLEEGVLYSAREVNERFFEWYSHRLSQEIFPQYSFVKSAAAASAKAAARCSAYEELDAMVGLTEAKSVVRNAVNYFKMQKLLRDRGIASDRPAMTMLFTGNPGSAKTTVARLAAQIFREEGILEGGGIVECGRADLVGKYVGWTASIVKDKFKKAQGGVLFIDEAYSLVDHVGGSYGDEAINTIVQEMENHREDVVVIFAGYPDKMEAFLDANPGLRSRIAFHVPFADYNVDELCEIAEGMAKKKGLRIRPDTAEKMRSVFAEISQESDFGNGRAARNLIEKAKMAMATRLMNSDLDALSREELVTLLPEDVQRPAVCKAVPARAKCIGFAS